MNKLYRYIITIALFASCTNRYHVLRKNNISIDSDRMEFKFMGYNSPDTLRSGEYELNNFSARSFYRFGITPKGGFVYFASKSNVKGNYKNGGFEAYFAKNRLQHIRFVDSLGFSDGLVFFFKKNGNMKHILNYNHGKLDSILYTNSPKKLKKDTQLLGKL
jgi:hypothetical protein